MSLLRTLAIAMSLALAACAAPASQDVASSQARDASADATAAQQATTPAAPSTRVHRLRTGGPNPPQRVQDNSCKVDADCTTKSHCTDIECRCVRDQCIVPGEAIDPVIDPAPATSVR
jgi:hypothetical protein